MPPISSLLPEQSKDVRKGVSPPRDVGRGTSILAESAAEPSCAPMGARAPKVDPEKQRQTNINQFGAILDKEKDQRSDRRSFQTELQRPKNNESYRGRYTEGIKQPRRATREHDEEFVEKEERGKERNANPSIRDTKNSRERMVIPSTNETGKIVGKKRKGTSPPRRENETEGETGLEGVLNRVQIRCGGLKRTQKFNALHQLGAERDS